MDNPNNVDAFLDELSTAIAALEKENPEKLKEFIAGLDAKVVDLKQTLDSFEKEEVV